MESMRIFVEYSIHNDSSNKYKMSTPLSVGPKFRFDRTRFRVEIQKVMVLFDYNKGLTFIG